MKCVLDGVTLTIGSGGGFAESSGSQPHMQMITVPVEMGAKLMRSAGRDESVLEIDAPELKKKVKFERLSIIGKEEASDPYHVTLTLVDDRFWWAYTEHFFHFNSPRRSGNRRRLDNQAPVANQPVVDDLVFAAWSLDAGTKRWTFERVIEVVMDSVAGTGNWFIRKKQGLVYPEVEDLKLSGNGQIVIAQMLAEMGGSYNIYRQKDGKFVIYSTLDEADRKAFGAPAAGNVTTLPKARPAIIGEGYWAITDKELERPERIRVLFERLIEVRMDFKKGQSRLTSDRIAPAATLTMVLQSPEDFTHQGRDILVGQWVDFDFYLDFLAGKQPSSLPVLSDDLIADLWLSGALDAYSSETLDPSGLWAARIDAIRASYRATFQLNQAWTDRIQNIEPVRVAVVDWESRTRAASPVFVDYAVSETWRARGKSVQAQPKAFDYVRNRYANPAAGPSGGQIVGTPYDRLTGAYAQISVEDAEQGIISITFGTGNDNTARFRDVFRSAIVPARNPQDSAIARNMWLQWGQFIKNYELSTIVSIVLGSPADGRRYHVEEVDIGEATRKLPFTNTPVGKGPPMDVRITGQLAVARFAWEDSRALDIYQLFAPFTSGQLPAVDPATVLGPPVNPTQLREIAVARAAAVYAQYHDHVIGRIGTGLEGDITVGGRVSKVMHVAEPRGAITRVSADASPPQLDWLAILPKSVRRTVDRFVDSGSAGATP